MKLNIHHIIGTYGVVMLFMVFTLVHHYEWLIPPSPVVPAATASSMPVPDVIEEHNGEDYLEHNPTEYAYEFLNEESSHLILISEDLFIPQIATPPPDPAI